MGRRIRHARAATVPDVENDQLSKQMMNTAQGHWNEHALPEGRVVYGLVTASLVLRLTSQDTASRALAEVSISELRFLAPVRQGTTVSAYSEVVDRRDDPEAGMVTFRHHGVDHGGTVVFRGGPDAPAEAALGVGLVSSRLEGALTSKDGDC